MVANRFVAGHKLARAHYNTTAARLGLKTGSRSHRNSINKTPVIDLLTRLCRRVYKLRMTEPIKRDNSYWLRRLEKDGRDDLLKMIEDGDITVYRASFAAGYRKKPAASSRSDQISYHYSRATLAEKRRFIIDNWSTIARIVGDLAERKRESEEAQKLSSADQN